MKAARRRDLARRLHEYARRMDAGEVLEAAGLVDDLNDAAEQLAVEEEIMVYLAPEYDWKKTFWKGLRPALIASGSTFLAVFIQSVDVQWFVRLGVPAFVATFLFEALRNYAKQHKGG